MPRMSGRTRWQAALGGWLILSGLPVGLLLSARAGVAAPQAVRVVATSAVHGLTTTQSGTVRLPGVEVTITPTATAGGEPVVTVSGEDGAFRATGLAPGVYDVMARLAGFEMPKPRRITVGPAAELEVNLDLGIAGVAQSVDVTARATPVPTDAPSAGDRVQGGLVDVLPVRGDDYQSMLPVVPGVMRGPDGRINMKGGRPTQTGLQVSNAYVTDPSTGSLGLELPVDAVASIDVLPNPFAAEYGRFSSGVTRIETRRGGDRWQVTANAFIPIPCLKVCDGVHWGIRGYDPRLLFDGPIVKGRLSLAQSFQLHYHKEFVTSLPVDEADTMIRSFDSFTRLDASLGTHMITGTVSLYPRTVQYANLNTFNAQPVTPDFRQRGYWVSVSDTAVLSPTTVVESSLGVKQFDAEVTSQGPLPMVLHPERNGGNYFNQQDRRTGTVQATSALTTVRTGKSGQHQAKFGVDLLQTGYTGLSANRPVIVARADGTTSWRIDFSGPSHQQVSSLDVAAFAQDRWRIGERFMVELGIRADHNGVVNETMVSPRAGGILSLLPEGRAIVRGGYGRFYERTPLTVGAFTAFEQRAITRFAADGVTPLGEPVRYTNVVPSLLKTPYSMVWNLEFDGRLAGNFFVRVNHLQREGEREYVVDPVESDLRGELRLGSSGLARYRETEVTLRYVESDRRTITATWVRSKSETDSNAFDEFFGNFRNPVIRAREFSLGGVDVPNRLIVSAAWPLPGGWSLSPLFEVRDGFPYSCVDENQDYVGAVNQCGRFPTLVSLDLNVLKTLTVRNRQVRVGLKVNHLLNNFSPRDVQANVDSVAFGTFYNSFPRRIGFLVELSPR